MRKNVSGWRRKPRKRGSHGEKRVTGRPRRGGNFLSFSLTLTFSLNTHTHTHTFSSEENARGLASSISSRRRQMTNPLPQKKKKKKRTRRNSQRRVHNVTHLECEYCLAPSVPVDVLTGDKPTAEADASPRSSVRSIVEYAAEVSCGE